MNPCAVVLYPPLWCDGVLSVFLCWLRDLPSHAHYFPNTVVVRRVCVCFKFGGLCIRSDHPWISYIKMFQTHEEESPMGLSLSMTSLASSFSFRAVAIVDIFTLSALSADAAVGCLFQYCRRLRVSLSVLMPSSRFSHR